MVCVTAFDGDLQVTTEVGKLGVLSSFVLLFMWQDQNPSGDKENMAYDFPCDRAGCVCTLHSAPFLHVMRHCRGFH